MNVFEKSLLVAGVVGAGTVMVAQPPASAAPLQAYASGSASIVLMNGASQAMGAEIAAPRGAVFEGATAGNGDVNATVAFTGDLNTNAALLNSLTVTPGLSNTIAPAAASSMEAAVAGEINAATSATLSDGVSYTRAWQSGNSVSSSSSGVQAYASGSSSIVLMDGASFALGGEIAAPKGIGFAGGAANGAVNVSVAFAGSGTNNLSLNSTTLQSLTVNPGTATSAPSVPSSVEAAVAAKIDAAGGTNLSDGVSYTRAWQSGLQ